MEKYNFKDSEASIKCDYIKNEITLLNGLLVNPSLPDNYRGAYYEIKERFCALLREYANEATDKEQSVMSFIKKRS